MELILVILVKMEKNWFNVIQVQHFEREETCKEQLHSIDYIICCLFGEWGIQLNVVRTLSSYIYNISIVCL